MANPKKRQEKAEAAKSKKAQDERMKKEAQEEEKWSKGAKNSRKKEEEAEKRRLAAERKAERARLEKEEMDSLPNKGKKQPAKKGGRFDIPSVETFSAHNLDDALDLLSLDKKSKDELERHPERRFKAAYTAYKEKRLPEIRKEQPGMRLNQYEDLMYKEFQKHPDNPFNKFTLKYNAKDEEVAAARAKRRAELEARLRE
ncbi:HMG-box [Schizosaccharomyces japonicus yFS275]|uniref:HMG-box n=1 Tax=Schizosaccharomyces japonicus (strain yFS275 / FY16936) TaxID=402676 RepID=B6K5E9_SCHJY|nr:HMG-box [Schizosaccharomyces japonicus yFS275]EEB08753.1 HMG-box [Schizosaccharomyces japonicus yFS275]